jgi:hypothetical protein
VEELFWNRKSLNGFFGLKIFSKFFSENFSRARNLFRQFFLPGTLTLIPFRTPDPSSPSSLTAPYVGGKYPWEYFPALLLSHCKMGFF